MSGGPIPQVVVSKVWVLNVGSKNFTLQGEARSWEFPSQLYGIVLGCGLWRECVSAFPTHFDLGIFSFTECVDSVWISSEVIVLCVAVHYIC